METSQQLFGELIQGFRSVKRGLLLLRYAGVSAWIAFLIGVMVTGLVCIAFYLAIIALYIISTHASFEEAASNVWLNLLFYLAWVLMALGLYHKVGDQEQIEKYMRQLERWRRISRRRA